MSEIIYCPKCGESDYIRERSPKGKTKCNNCGFVDSNYVWDYLRYCDKVKILQAENKTLKDFAKEAIKNNEFYGNNKNWKERRRGDIELEDVIMDDGGLSDTGGKRAREFQNSDIYKQVKEMIK